MSEAASKTGIRLRRKIAYGVFVAVFFLFLSEGLLCVLGVRPARESRDLFIGFEPGVPLFLREGNQYVTNELKLSFFNQQSFSVEKAPRTFRVFSLGGSTSYGHPFDARSAYTAWLQELLEALHPERTWEVVNCGGISYASYRLAQLMEELAGYQPDLFIVYTGHNEFLEERAYGEVRERSPLLTWSLLLASHLRLFELFSAAWRQISEPPSPATIMAAEVDTILERSDGPESYHRDDTLHARVVEHYRDSLRRMIRIAQRCNARLILIQPASNLRDFSPFKSEHGGLDPGRQHRFAQLLKSARRELADEKSDAALRCLTEAELLDPRHAMALWEHGRALLSAGRNDEALRYFVRAKDEDVCPLRALTSIHRAVSEVGREFDVPVIDFPRMLAEKCRRELGHDAVGLESFFDHVHPNLGTHRELGIALHDAFVALSIVPRRALSEAASQRIDERIHGSLSHFDSAMALHTLAMTLSWAGKNAEALTLAELAAQGLPKNSEVLSQHARILAKLGRDEEALTQYQKALDSNPDDSLTLFRLALLLMKREQYETAARHLRRAIDLTPKRAPRNLRLNMRLSLADCSRALGQLEAARQIAHDALRLDPGSAAAHQMLQELSKPAASADTTGLNSIIHLENAGH